MKTTLRLTIAACGLAIFTLSTALVQAEDYTYTTDDGTITITGYTGPGGAVTIPSTINGSSVTSIGDEAFGFTSLASVTIPNSVTNIGYGAFLWCTNLTSVTIGSGVTKVGNGVFTGCDSLTAITVNTNNPVYSSVEGVLFSNSESTIVRYPEGKAGTSYTIPNSVTSIEGSWPGGGAFYYCENLTNVTIGNSVTGIGELAFSHCTSLTSLTIPNSVTSIEFLAFQDCTSLTSLTIPNSVTSIEFGTVQHCTSLTSVTIPDSVTNIEQGTFWGCTSLTGVYFKGNAPSLLWDAFSGADNATVYYLPGTTGWGTTYGGRPTAQWWLPNPLILNNGPSFGVQTNQFGFIISWATNISVVVEASTTLANPIWSPVSTNTLTDGWTYFSHAEWTNYPVRFYRVRQW